MYNTCIIYKYLHVRRTSEVLLIIVFCTENIKKCLTSIFNLKQNILTCHKVQFSNIFHSNLISIRKFEFEEINHCNVEVSNRLQIVI